MLALRFMINSTYAQLDLYTFSQSNGTYTEITGGTILGTATSNSGSGSLNDIVYTVNSLPSFTFNGSAYTSIFVSTNGFITFGSAPLTSNYYPISSYSEYTGAIASWGGDNNGMFDVNGFTSEIRYEVLGSSPNRIIVIQWKNFRHTFSTSTTNVAYLNYQIRLYEADGNVEIVYGPSGHAAGSTNLRTTKQIGIRGSTNTDYLNRFNYYTRLFTVSIDGTDKSDYQSFSSINATPGQPSNGLTYTYIAPTNELLDIYELFSPPSITVNCGTPFEAIYGQCYEPDVTNMPGQGAGVQCWIGVSTSPTNPNTWTKWYPASYSGDSGNADQYSLVLPNFAPGTYYYATRWRLNSGVYTYGGYNANGGGPWDGNTYVSGVLTVNPALPSNDESSGAASISLTTYGDACTYTYVETSCASQSTTVDQENTCTDTGIDDDVWYVFTSTVNGPYTFSYSGLIAAKGTASSIGMNLYTGAPGSLTEVSNACYYTYGNGVSGSVIVSLNASTTYYLRLFVSNSPNAGIFDFCITTPPPAPPNDECFGAIAFDPIPTDGITCSTKTVDTYPAWGSNDATCFGTEDDDLWYSFTVPDVYTRILYTNTTISGSLDRVLQLFDACDGNSLGCYNFESGEFTGLTPGNTYIIRAYTLSALSRSIFELCLKTPPACANPSLLSSRNITSTTAELGWLENGGSTTWDIEKQPAPFNFTGTPTVSGVINPYVITGLTLSTDYQFKVRPSTCQINWSAPSPTFTTLGMPPANDEASSAIALTLSSTCTDGTLVNATAQYGEPSISCEYTEGNSATVWYSFEAPASGMVKVSTDYTVPDGLTDSKIGIYSTSDVNDYSTFNLLACDEDNGVNIFLNSIVYCAGLNAGQTYYIKVDKYSEFSESAPFCITVEEVVSSMLSTTTGCPANVSNNYTEGTGWISIVDASGNLIANVNSNGNDISAAIASQHINTGTVRQDALGHYYLDRNNLINVSTQPSSPVSIQLFFTDTELAALTAVDPTATLSNLVINKQSGTTCHSDYNDNNGVETEIPVTSYGGNATVSYIQGDVSSFSNFYISSASNPLPVSILSFNAKATATHEVLTSWKVANEIHIESYQIERSIDGRNWKLIGTVNASNAKTYRFTDKEPMKGTNYYRLSIHERDGKLSYSEIRSVLFNVKGIISAYPNPANQVIYFEGSSARDLTVEVYNEVGMLVNSIKTSGSELASNGLDIAHLTPGIYVAYIKSSDEMVRMKFVKQ